MSIYGTRSAPQSESDEITRDLIVALKRRNQLEKELATATKERDEWKAKAEANERDAARYRWFRDDWWLDDDPEKLQPDLDMMLAETAEQFDAAIDAARSTEKEKE